MTLFMHEDRAVSYGDAVVDDGIGVWPAAWDELRKELQAGGGRVALIAAASPADADALVEQLQTDVGVGVARLGRELADHAQPPSLTVVESVCGDATVLTDLDALLWPTVPVAPLQLLTLRARRRPTIAVWPGSISSGRATYSTPGRPDHHDIPLRDSVVLRPRGMRFPDETPFTIERIRR
jgi:hypothetical protein